MALVKCKECSKEISSEAKACPHCGAKPPKPTSRLAVLLIGIAMIAIYVEGTKKDTPPQAVVTISPEQAALNKKQADEKTARVDSTIRVLASIKASLREPESVKWASVLSSDDGAVVCVTYRARNGFGGMNVEDVSFSKGKISKAVPAWNKNCAGKSLNDMKYVGRMLEP
jgi:hypothetical protein